MMTKERGRHRGCDALEQNPWEGRTVVFVETEEDAVNADGIRGHLEVTGDRTYREGFYERWIKRFFDVILSFCGLVVLSPLMLGICLAIRIEDSGSVFFTQKRVGQNKSFFYLHKFRSMRMETPPEVPTHRMEHPEQYLTKSGRFLRAFSLDELPQLWDIFIGHMSIVGPRPALWNQELLIAERERYGANDVKPGLTGWAQINGRDDLSIQEKARFDGEYVERIGLRMDGKIFFGTLSVVFRGDRAVSCGGDRVAELREDQEVALKGDQAISLREDQTVALRGDRDEEEPAGEAVGKEMDEDGKDV